MKAQNPYNISQSKITVPAGIFLIPVISFPLGTSNTTSGASLLENQFHCELKPSNNVTIIRFTSYKPLGLRRKKCYTEVTDTPVQHCKN